VKERRFGWPLRGVLWAGLASLALGGGPGVLFAGTTLVAMAWSGPRLSGAGWAGAHGAALLGTALVLAVGAPTHAFSLLVCWLLAHRAWMGRSSDDTRVAVLLATLLLLLGAVGTESFLLAPVFAVYAALLPVALLRAELQGSTEAPPRGLELGLGGASAVIAALLFLVLPRLDGGYLSRGELGGQRFPEDVTLGEEGLVSDDAAEVIRAVVTGPDGAALPGPFHFRGRALDTFDGTRWSAEAPVERGRRNTTWDHRAEVWLAPIGGDLLFGVPEMIRVEGVPNRAAPGGAFVPTVPGRALDYVAYGRAVPLADIATADNDPWLQLPATLDGRVTTLAWTVVPAEEADPVVVANGLSAWLGATYTYVDTPPPPEGDPVAWFLFDAKAGHCEYFASALTVLLRARGIPARLATGFYSDERAADGAVVARRGNAHAWVEVRTAAGWATLDPTPPSGLPQVDTNGLRARFDALVASWYRDVVEYDMEAQFSAYGAIGKSFVVSGDGRSASPVRTGLVGMMVVMATLTGGLVIGRAAIGRLGAPAARKRDAGARLCADARAAVRARGWAVPDDLPMLDAAAWLEERAGPDAAAFRRLAELVYAARYTNAPLALSEARACVRALRRIAKPRLTSGGARG